MITISLTRKQAKHLANHTLGTTLVVAQNIVWDAINKTDAESEGIADRAQLRDFEGAHAEGLHDELPRELCPECEARRGGER